MAEDAGAADLIAGGRLQLGISRGSPEQVIDGFRHFGYVPPEGHDRRRHGAAPHRGVSRGAARQGLRQAQPVADVSEPAGPVAPRALFRGPARAHLVGRRHQRHRAMGGQARHEPAVFDVQDRRERQAVPRPAGRADPALQGGVAGSGACAHARGCRCRAASSRSPTTATGCISAAAATRATRSVFSTPTRAPFSAAATPPSRTCSSRSSSSDEAIAEADTILLTVPNQLGVDYNAHVIESILKHVAPGLGWR